MNLNPLKNDSGVNLIYFKNSTDLKPVLFFAFNYVLLMVYGLPLDYYIIFCL